MIDMASARFQRTGGSVGRHHLKSWEVSRDVVAGGTVLMQCCSICADSHMRGIGTILATLVGSKKLAGAESLLGA